MGEEEKKAEEKKMEEKKGGEEGKVEAKKEEKKAEEKKEEKKSEESKDSTPPPPQEIVLSLFMHCEGCAKKVRRSLKGFPGVEDVQTDCKTHKVVVKGEKADPLNVRDRVQMKSHRQVELLSPIPKPPAPEDKKPEAKEAPKPEEKKEEPKVITVVLKVHMHCEACAQEIKKRIQRMKGVENAEPDLKSSQVTVNGVFDPPALVDYVYKKTGKQAVIVKQEPEKKEDKGKDDKKGDEGEKKKGEDNKGKEEKKDGGGEAAAEKAQAPAAAPAAEGGGDAAAVEMRRNELLYYYNYPQQQHYQFYPPPQAQAQRFPGEIYQQYPPQMFSDENPNACSVM